VVSPVVIWSAVRFGDWRGPSDGGWGKALAGVVLVAVVVPLVATAETVRWWPQLRAVRRGQPGRWMDARAFAEETDEPTGNLIFRRSHVVRHH
jgi:hypothetical protein